MAASADLGLQDWRNAVRLGYVRVLSSPQAFVLCPPTWPRAWELLKLVCVNTLGVDSNFAVREHDRDFI